MYDVKGVFQALLATIIIVAILTVFAIQTTVRKTISLTLTLILIILVITCLIIMVLELMFKIIIVVNHLCQCDFTSCGAMICMMSIMLFVFGALFVSFAVGQEHQEVIFIFSDN